MDTLLSLDDGKSSNDIGTDNNNSSTLSAPTNGENSRAILLSLNNQAVGIIAEVAWIGKTQ